MRKTIGKLLKISALALTVAVLTIAFIILFPQPLFANKMAFKNFTVYSNEKVDERIKLVLDHAMALIQKSELYDPGYTYNIILCHNTFYDKIDNALMGAGPAARTTINNIVVKVKIDVEKNLAFPTFHKACEVNLTELLAHELTHCLQANKYGILKFNPFRHPDMWKLEGYPEYIARQPELSAAGYDLKGDIAQYVKLVSVAKDGWVAADEGGCEVPDYYYKGKLMMEYLIDIRHWSYDRILKDTTSENTIYQEMINWAD